MLMLIAAMGHGGVIGINNTLPWHLPADLRRFRSLTMGHAVVMGRKTHESIGKALPGRCNIVVSRSSRCWEGCESAQSLPDALQRAGGAKVFVIGGGELYRQALPLAERLYITEVEVAVAGDTFFPSIDGRIWRERSREAHAATPPAPAYVFVVYERRGGCLATISSE